MPSINSAFGTDLIASFAFNVAASTTVNYNYIPASQFGGTKFIVEVLDLVDGRSRFFDVNATRLSSDDPKDQLFGKVGDGIAYTFKVVKVATDITLEVTNNDSNTLQITVIRITA